MDPHHDNVEHLPDESYIERLFPKCPPKQSTCMGGDQNKAKRLQGVRGSRETQKRARSKVHQHSRRELEARRNKAKAANYFRDKANSSDSSDNEAKELNKKNNLSRQSTSDSLQKSSLSSEAAASSIPSTSRRVGKYAASQSLLMQLQRSQSSYTNSNIASSHQSEPNKNSTEPKAAAPGQDKPMSRTSGIVKSSSSFAFVNDSKALSQNSYPQQQQQQQYAYSQSIMNKSQEPDEYHRADNRMGDIENDNRMSDHILGNEFNYNNNNNNERSSILKGTWLKREIPEQVAALNWNDDVASFNNTTDPQSSQLNNNDKSPEYSNNLEASAVDKKSNHARIEAKFDSSAPCLNSMPSATAASFDRTADLCSRDRIEINNNNKTDPPPNIVSIDPTIQLINQTTPQNSLGKSDKTALLKTNSVNKTQGSSVEESLERKDDDKYINLSIVFDGTAQSSAKNQPTPSDKQQKPSKNQLKKIRNRRRCDRLANNKKSTTPKTDEESLDLLKSEGSEITEVIDEEQAAISASIVTSSIVEPSLSLAQTEPNQAGLEQPLVQFRRELDLSPSIVAIHHQASQQLLTTTDLNDHDESIIRNDASTEELCSNNDNSVDELRKSIIETEHNTDKRINHPSLGKTLSCARASSIITPLQTVDEKAEINIKEQSVIGDDELDKSELVDGQNTTDTMPFDQLMNHTTKKGFVPPGYPQLVRPAKATSSEHKVEPPNLVEGMKEVKPIRVMTNKLNNSPSLEVKHYQESSSRSAKSDNLRVKFDEENLVRVQDHVVIDQSSSDGNSELPNPGIAGHKLYEIGARGSEHPPQMPSISEAQFESEVDPTKDETTLVIPAPTERDLSAGLKKISLSDSSNREQVASSESMYQHEAQSDASQRQAPAPWRKNFYNLEHKEVESHPTTSSGQVDQDQASDNPKFRSSIGNESSLRHHKLLNETSHYSIVRSVNNSAPEPATVPRSSSLQFNTFSDGESGPDEQLNSPANIPDPSISRNHNIIKKSDSSSAGFMNRPNNLPASSSKSFNDDELLPTTKTALIFPRLDEGLSSDAESCEDEVEEEDERAMDADVDADDDDDEDDVDDDITENDSLPAERTVHSVQMSQPSSLDCFSRPLQSAKAPTRLMSSMQQQHQQTQPLVMDQQVEIHQAKAPGSAYGGYIGQDLLDNNDLKSMTGYPNQNGQPNSWMSVANQQPHLSTAQPSSSQHFSQRGHHNNNSFNRDEAKVTSRLSSDTDNETDRLLGSQRNEQLKLAANDVNSNNSSDLQPVSNVMKQTANSREVLIEGVLFNVRYLGSTHSDCEGRSEKEDRIHQAEMAVHEVKFRNGESQSATEVQLFISTEKIMVLDDKHRKIMMDHSLRTISYIADIGDAIVLIVRKKNSNSEAGNDGLNRPVSKISCHVFESSESHTITKSISQAFQVAYTELLKANGTGDTSSYLPKELDYQEVLNSQEMSTDELEMFARKENQREVIVPKEKGEILGLSLVESGWGSVLPTVVIANLKPDGPAYRCKRLSIGDQILSVNGISLVGLPLAECQEILRKTKNQRVARLSVVPCPITVEVKIKRPDTKYQLGFSVQNGVICSLLRGGIAERGGVRVGHRIMSINGTTVVGVPHEKIVTLLASSVGEIRMKTCLTSLYRLILGEEHPVHF